jgi:type I restriction enzyme M protein
MNDTGELEKTLWAAADKLRSNMDAAEYKHVVLGLIFLKYISDAFDEKRRIIESIYADPNNEWFIEETNLRTETLEEADEYASTEFAPSAFYVPVEARWLTIQNNAKQPIIGKIIDDAMDAIERINVPLKGILPKIYADPELDKQRLGELIDLISTIGFNQAGHKSKDLLGRVYEYFLGQFADAEGKRGGQFYTAQSIVKLLVEMLEPYEGRIYDGCCGSGGMFVQSEKFVEAHGGNINKISVFGQESNPTTLRLCKMNLAIRGIDAKIELGDTFTNDKHPDLKADYIMANPPFNISDWSGEHLREDKRWAYGIPPTGNANYAWLQHFVHKLSPRGSAGIVLANGSMNSNTSTEGDIRRALIENANVVDCMVALPSQLFYNTMIPVCLWFLSRDRGNRDNEILFIDARKLGYMTNRRNRSLSDEDMNRITDTYHVWKKGENTEGSNIAGFSKAATLEEVRTNGYVLMPGRYVGTEEVEEDVTVFDDRMKELTATIAAQFAQSHVLENRIRENLKGIGYEW